MAFPKVMTSAWNMFNLTSATIYVLGYFISINEEKSRWVLGTYKAV